MEAGDFHDAYSMVSMGREPTLGFSRKTLARFPGRVGTALPTTTHACATSLSLKKSVTVTAALGGGLHLLVPVGRNSGGPSLSRN